MTSTTQSKVVVLTFDCLGAVTTFSKDVNINIDHPTGFIVRQVAYKKRTSGTTEIMGAYMAKDTGDTLTQTEYKDEYKLDPTNVIATPIVQHFDPELYVYTLYTSITNETIATFTDPSVTCPQTFFKLTNNVNGAYNFRIDESSTSPSTHATGVLTIVLEFVKY